MPSRDLSTSAGAPERPGSRGAAWFGQPSGGLCQHRSTSRAALSSARLANPPTRLSAALASGPRWGWGPHGGRPVRTESEPSRGLWPGLGAALGTGADEACSALLGIASTWLGALSRTESFFSSAGASSSSMRTLDSATFDDATLEVAPITVGAKPAAEGRLRR